MTRAAARRTARSGGGARAGKRGEVRIIGGQWRGRRIGFPDSPGLRPTPDRVRETLFNWLGQDLSGLHCLDLYAGSGALGFEALSRGAKHVTLVERNAAVMEALKNNAAMLQATGLELIRADALEFVRHNAGASLPGSFDVIFLDAPFETGVPAQVLELLPALLAPGGRVFLESSREPVLCAHWQTEKSSRAGLVHFQLLRWESA